MAKLPVLVAVGAAAGVIAVPAPGSVGAARWFFTPGRSGVSCQLEVRRPTTDASCLAYQPGSPYRTAVAVTMSASGKLSICRGLRCIGNAPEHTPTLAAGRSIELGPFRCTSLTAGVRCIVTKLGHGFRLSTLGVNRI